ncbi:MAG: LrgB family protein [Schaedlerella sp.]|nr:LrgB family protein [Lachnospiraceae bacterium]MDY4202890.1 LrgB family protein [Schaedlerella sp.]
MNNFLTESVFFGLVLSLSSYVVGTWLKKRFKLAVLNPLLLSIIMTILVLLITGVDYQNYYTGAKYISYLLTPATVSLAIPLYEQMEILKKNWKAVIAGIVSGVLTALCSILFMAYLFGLGHAEYVTLLPKSITTAIGMDVSAELGGYVSITVAVIIITGVFGNVIAETVFRIFRIKEPVAKGIALGTSAHAIGTSKAMELGGIEGAMSSLSIVVCGILTVFGTTLFAQFL